MCGKTLYFQKAILVSWSAYCALHSESCQTWLTCLPLRTQNTEYLLCLPGCDWLVLGRRAEPLQLRHGELSSAGRHPAPHVATTSNNIPSNLCLRSDQHFMASRDSAESSSFNDQETSQETSQESVSSLGPHMWSVTPPPTTSGHSVLDNKGVSFCARDSSPLISEGWMEAGAH